ncbi:MAG: spermine synthase [Candidatus Omnitrophica bacterium]|nr:spermine synthase [Candidatus Omnitrophota bacterium]MDD5591841.1 spermine synthase [Candidatus Omnitrophota bacterium]
MSYILTLSIIVVGLSGIVAQITLLRELLVSFYGNELTLGVILANWVISEAAGVYIIGGFIDRAKNKINVFIILQIAFASMLGLSVYLSRTLKPILGIPFGEAIGLPMIFYSSFLIMLPVGFCHGALFSCACKIYSSYIKESAHSIGKAYTLETIGTIIGGVAVTYFFIPYFNSFQTVTIIAVFNLILCLLFFKNIPKMFKYVVLFLIFLMIYLSSSGALNKIQDYAIKKQWNTQDVLDYRNSVYGNVVVVKKEQQHTFFYNGLPIITTPYPDIAFVQDFGNIPLLFHPQPREVLILSAGAGGLINEIRKHPVIKIDYAELDPLIIDMLKKYPSDLTKRELQDERVKVINQDARFFVKNTFNRYDIVLIGLSGPADLSTGRFFTQEFFGLIKKRLNAGGILVFCLPGSLAYLSSELRDLNACILNALKKAYPYIRIIPGDYNMFLASDSTDIMAIDSRIITQRIKRGNIKTDMLVPAYLDYRLDKEHLEWFIRSLMGATRKINRDFMPFAVFQISVLWNKQFSPIFAYILQSLGNLNFKVILLLIFAITLMLFFIFCRKPKLNIAYSMATTGFFGMLINLTLIFTFQVVYGYLYHKIGLLTGIFMAGITLGSIFMTSHIGKIKDSLSLFIKLEAAIVLFSYLSAWIITGFFNYTKFSLMLFIIMFFISGLLVGLEFPLANKMYLKDKTQVGSTSGLLYFSDLMGGWLAGIVGAAILLPVLGLFGACMIIIFLKLSSLLLLAIFSKRLPPLDKPLY